MHHPLIDFNHFFFYLIALPITLKKAHITLPNAISNVIVPQLHSITVKQLKSYNIYKCYLVYLIVTLYVLPFVSQI
jgi:hypothetical protein